jgi:Fur family ferric uptake transcriptional regulator
VVPILEQARDRVRATGARVTGARVKVLAVLIQADEALTHTDVQHRLEHGDAHELLDRVTLYRVLEWLVETGLAHRVSGPDRVWRFSAHGDEVGPGHVQGLQHGHFKCRACERMFCMKSSARLARTVRGMLPEGFAGDAVELTVLGCCADCAQAASDGGKAPGGLGLGLYDPASRRPQGGRRMRDIAPRPAPATTPAGDDAPGQAGQ